ncbi:MAG: hypothetical protein DLM57_08965 [Pseudonocardiales bacterium]|nr:MAG: hypothetical protein DLM57_08965 [Pseudonocardiales bacterium]
MVPPPLAARGGSQGGVVAIMLTMALLLVGTVASWIYVHQDKTSSSSTVQTIGGQRAAGASSGSGGGARATSTAIKQPNGAYPTPSNPYATPTPPPLDQGAVQRTMEAYLNAVQNHDLEATKSLVCPKFRATYRGTYSPQGYAYSGWSAHYQDPVVGTNYAYVVVTQGLLDTRTGVKKGSETHSWVVQRDAGTYYVCGYLV